MILLDTNALIAYLNGTSTALARRLHTRPPDQVYLSSIVKAELFYGARRSARKTAILRMLEEFLAPFTSLPFDDRCAEIYGIIRADLAGRGAPIGPDDLMIAATALAHDLTLITRNTREYSRVTGLKVENWEIEGPEVEPTRRQKKPG